MSKANQMNIVFTPIWFDSLGAKSSCCLIGTPDVTILIDPGAAELQPGFPAPAEKKRSWLGQAERAIEGASEKAAVIIVSHYHHDHYGSNPETYRGKTLFVKDPNEYINDSQRERAEEFFSDLYRGFAGESLEGLLIERKPKGYPDPIEGLPLARDKDYGDYNPRKRELLQKGRNWFYGRVKKWNKNKDIPELDLDELCVRFPEGKGFIFGNTKLRFTEPLFHGVEFSRVGWVFAVVVEYEDEKLMYSSDLNGPIIEDYTELIIKEDPDILILDGPMTYMFGYTLNRINLDRTIENACNIVNRIDAKLIIYDHHLSREKRYRERTQEVWDKNSRVMTAAEYLGKVPEVMREGR